MSTVLLSQYKVQVLEKKELTTADLKRKVSFKVKILKIMSGDSIFKEGAETYVTFAHSTPIDVDSIICLEQADGGGLDDKGQPWASVLWTLIDCPKTPEK